MMDWSGQGTTGWGYVAMGVVMLAFVALLTLGVAVFARRRARVGPAVTGVPAGPTPQELLDGRLARGEIDEADYASRRETLAAKAGT